MAGWPGGRDGLLAGGGPFLRRQLEPQRRSLTDLQVCQAAFANPNPATSTGINNEKGFRWAEDMGGFTLFNTIVPPTSTQYSFTWCALQHQQR